MCVGYSRESVWAWSTEERRAEGRAKSIEKGERERAGEGRMEGEKRGQFQ